MSFNRPCVGRMREVHANANGDVADRAACHARAFEKDACNLATIQQHVIGPLQGKPFRTPRDRGKGVIKRQRRHKGAQSHLVRSLGRAHDQRACKVANRINPGPPPPSASLCLAQAKDPFRTGELGRDARCFGIGAVDFRQNAAAVSIRPLFHFLIVFLTVI